MSGFRRFLVLAIACFVLGVPLAADAGMLVPREVFVGDTADFSFETTVFASILKPDLILTVPSADIPVSPDVTIESIQVVPRTTGKGGVAVVSIRFVPWTAGALALPSFTLKKIKLTPPLVRIMSLVDKTGRSTLEPPRSPLLVPGTTYLLYGGIAVGLVAVTAAALMLARLRRFLTRNSGQKRSGRRVRHTLRQLKHLERSVTRLEMKPWYARYSALVRGYLGDLSAGNPDLFIPYTGTEIVVALGERLSGHETGSLLADVRSLLGRIDIIRFSGHPSEDNRTVDIATLRDLIPILESVAVIVDFDVTVEEEAADAQL